MKDEQLKEQLLKIDLNQCIEVRNNQIYYIKKPVKQRCSNEYGSFNYITDDYEFLIIAYNGEKQAIIYRCGYVDLHWYVLKKWRNKHILSDVLRTGIIKEIWSENKTITCCYNYNDNRNQKYAMTKHLADLAGLKLE